MLAEMTQNDQKQSDLQRVHLYDAATIDQLPWPDTEEGSYAKSYLVPFIKKGPSAFIKNVRTSMYALTIDDLVFPVTVNDNEYENCWVCSPYSQYVNYAAESVRKINNPIIKKSLLALISSYSRFFKWGEINKLVYLNNWLLSTDLYPKVNKEQLSLITAFLSKRFSDHVIAMRSLNEFYAKDLMSELKDIGFEMVGSRQVFLQETNKEKVLTSRMFSKDLKLLQKTDYQVLDTDEILEEHIPQILAHYNSLYLDKHSKNNPQLSVDFIELAVKNRVLSLRGLAKDGKLDAVVGYFKRNGVMTSPLFGYDLTVSKDKGLYRILSTLLSLAAKEQGCLLNQSSGAGSFKRLRRGQPYIDYVAVYHRHLPWRRKSAWRFLHYIINYIGVPFMRHYDF